MILCLALLPGCFGGDDEPAETSSNTTSSVTGTGLQDPGITATINAAVWPATVGIELPGEATPISPSSGAFGYLLDPALPLESISVSSAFAKVPAATGGAFTFSAIPRRFEKVIFGVDVNGDKILDDLSFDVDPFDTTGFTASFISGQRIASRWADILPFSRTVAHGDILKFTIKGYSATSCLIAPILINAATGFQCWQGEDISVGGSFSREAFLEIDRNWPSTASPLAPRYHLAALMKATADDSGILQGGATLTISGTLLGSATIPTGGSITLDNGAETCDSNVVAITASCPGAWMFTLTDDSGKKRYFKEGSTLNWQLSAGAGIKTVTARFGDPFGNLGSPVSASIQVLQSSTDNPDDDQSGTDNNTGSSGNNDNTGAGTDNGTGSDNTGTGSGTGSGNDNQTDTSLTPPILTITKAKAESRYASPVIITLAWSVEGASQPPLVSLGLDDDQADMNGAFIAENTITPNVAGAALYTGTLTAEASMAAGTYWTYGHVLTGDGTILSSTYGPSFQVADPPSSEDVNRKPDEPTIIFPAPATSSAPVNGTLQWNCLDPDGDQLVYDLYFGSDSPPPLVKSNLASPQHPFADLMRSITYHWRIVARDPSGFTSEIQSSFTVSPAPSVALVYPLGGETLSDDVEILWATGGGTSPAGCQVTIQFSQGQNQWRNIVTNIPDTGSYTLRTTNLGNDGNYSFKVTILYPSGETASSLTGSSVTIAN
ncbi:MAG: hypothetical protein CVV64_20095 [Candidatus Wallbacteria bacterium HGW-Wallbacteria-1]|jgi:hypothetical protein|uniref:Fibronectin type-III domain-containing protein n=1 Tax=Candidatus Wallbacteria bacterium HGW-Wallbacteria-1 TaxID=2013854 RepID=A0A2N1PIJ2_9BACT|nr:MAG: hypothetical protein CVV64_20095 [Candidatus Wallbacteria bacterium HGW-Wallbacteria-1]